MQPVSMKAFVRDSPPPHTSAGKQKKSSQPHYESQTAGGQYM
jgi:hypothetical protein